MPLDARTHHCTVVPAGSNGARVLASAAQPGSPPAEEDPRLRVERAGRDQRRGALALLLGGCVDERAPQVDAFIAFAAEHGLVIDDLWIAWRDDRQVASALLVPSPGRTAMAFTSRVARADGVAAGARVLATACGAQDPTRLRLIQVLLDPHQRLEAEAATAAGFNDLARLLYMQRRADRRRVPLQLDPELAYVSWSAQTKDRFTAAILASYRGTLDCPDLVGLREIDDILAGHHATGQFEPDLWLAVHRGDEPVAVMLLNPVPRQNVMELVYLGVSPSWRGRGVGRALLAHGVSLARGRGTPMVQLAVDMRNRPALQLYRSLQFNPTVQKRALIRPMP